MSANYITVPSVRRQASVIRSRVILLIICLAVGLLSPHASCASIPTEDMLRATVRVFNGALSGTAFIIAVGDKTDVGRRYLLITAAHLFEGIDASKCTIVYRAPSKDNGLIRKETELVIREGKKPLWVKHVEADIAVIAVTLPDGIDIKPFEYSQIADAKLAEDHKIQVGQEVFIPCFPAQVEANPAGWPILRKGSIASYPLTPLASAKTIFVDYAHFGGDSGAPVVALIDQIPVVVGLVIAMKRLTDKTVTTFEERTVHTSLGLAIAVQSPYIRQTVDEWRKKL